MLLIKYIFFNLNFENISRFKTNAKRTLQNEYTWIISNIQ